MEGLRKRIQTILDQVPCRSAIVIINHSTGTSLELHPDRVFPAA
ncbi:MAG: hypothetical protein K0R22_123, partial [Sporomusa sp.]|nr:hypothetical protein [Sporomusa sp.]